MSVKKIYLDKETILKNIDNKDFMESIAKSEILIMDTWASDFIKNLNKENEKDRGKSK